MTNMLANKCDDKANDECQHQLADMIGFGRGVLILDGLLIVAHVGSPLRVIYAHELDGAQ